MLNGTRHLYSQYHFQRRISMMNTMVKESFTRMSLYFMELQLGVISVLPDTKYELQTTRSPAFLGLEINNHTNTKFDELTGNDIVVGIVDTGIWPESESFNDTGFKSIPSHWKGASANGGIDEEVEYKSPRDQDGHGTHTAATVAGSPVRGANLFGHAFGTARGMSPGARIAVYKVCWTGGCFSSDILSAVDRAVKDGVNVLSISLGGGSSSYYRDSLSIAAFGAMEKGVLVSCAAGNDGPEPGSITNVSPWMITVGASTIDRDFPGTVKLGTGKILNGVSVYKDRKQLSPDKNYSLVFTGSNITKPDSSLLCMERSLDETWCETISRGPNAISPTILKPDVVAPGVNILAAWTGDMAPSGLETDERRVKYNILSGTSMSCPHVSGVAAWLMARHPDWSVAAIKSALMTTAYTHDNTFEPLIDSSTGRPTSAYDHGAGHINPSKALDPGLVYDIGPQDYFNFLCSQGLTRTELSVFAKFSNRTCKYSLSSPSDLNYPALSVVFPKDKRVLFVTIKRDGHQCWTSKLDVPCCGFPVQGS
ncbi:subtilisin-like protease SBT1.3 [Tanacetum coccineum]